MHLSTNSLRNISTSPISTSRLNLTTALNGYSSTEFINNYIPNNRSNYHEKISTILNSDITKPDTPTWKEINAKILKDRQSFYDNYNEDLDLAQDQNKNQYKFSNNNKSLVYRSEKHIQIEETVDSIKPSTPTCQSDLNERDDFEDLIDLTHRIPKKVFKKISSVGNDKESLKVNKPITSQVNTKSNEQVKKALPPLPFSFVSLNSESSCSSSFNSNSSCSGKSGSEKISFKPKEPVNVNKPQATRLIIPLVNNKSNPSSRSNTPADRFYSSSQANFSKPVGYNKFMSASLSSNLSSKQQDYLEQSKRPSNKTENNSTEWEQISKIFDSLETLLNDVVESKRRVETVKSVPGTPVKENSFVSRISSSSNSLCRDSNSQMKKSIAGPTYLNEKNLKWKEVSEFLERIGMRKYEERFLLNGYDDLNFMNGVLGLQDLLQIGVENYDDAFKLLKEVKYLPARVKRMDNEHFYQISEWLAFLNLSQYTTNFTRQCYNNLTDLRYLWDIEISTIIQIPIPGHRRRISAALEIYKLNIKDNPPDSLSSSSYSSSSYNTLCNTSTSYKQLPTSFTKVSTPTNKDFRSVKFSDENRLDNSTSQDSSSSPELSGGEVSLIQFNDNMVRMNDNLAKEETMSDIVQQSFLSCVSTTKEERKSPKQIWKSDPKNLIRSSANFAVQYLGSSALIKTSPDEDPVKKTIDRLKKTSRSTPYQSPKVELAVSISGVKLLNVKTKDLLWNHDIKHINNVCQDQDDLNYFAFSTQTDPNAYYYCHVFACKDKDLSTQIILTIGQAFDLAYELFCKNNMS